MTNMIKIDALQVGATIEDKRENSNDLFYLLI
jgi:hypothetical protein